MNDKELAMIRRITRVCCFVSHADFQQNRKEDQSPLEKYTFSNRHFGKTSVLCTLHRLHTATRETKLIWQNILLASMGDRLVVKVSVFNTRAAALNDFP